MPLSTALPPQSIEFYSDLTYPAPWGLAERGINAPLNTGNQSRSRARYSQGLNPLTGGVGGATTGGVVGPRVEELGGRLHARVSSTAGIFAQGWRPQDWAPGWNAADFNGGALYDPGSVVGIFDFTAAAMQLAFAGAADVTGFWFQPRFDVFTQPSVAAGAPGGATPLGGFGIALNDDGGGNNQWEFVSYNGVPTILQRTVLAVPDVLDFTTFRLTVIAANSGRPANVSLAVNGANVAAVQNLDADDVVIMRPNTLQALAANYYFGQALGALGGGGLRFSVYCRFGRFTADGIEIQAP